MGFHEFSSPYDWSRIASFKRTAKAAFGGMVDLSVGSPVDPVPDSVRKALGAASNDPNAYGYPVTAGTADLRSAIAEWFAAARNVDLTAIDADVVPPSRWPQSWRPRVASGPWCFPTNAMR